MDITYGPIQIISNEDPPMPQVWPDLKIQAMMIWNFT